MLHIHILGIYFYISKKENMLSNYPLFCRCFFSVGNQIQHHFKNNFGRWFMTYV